MASVAAWARASQPLSWQAGPSPGRLPSASSACRAVSGGSAELPVPGASGGGLTAKSSVQPPQSRETDPSSLSPRKEPQQIHRVHPQCLSAGLSLPKYQNRLNDQQWGTETQPGSSQKRGGQPAPEQPPSPLTAGGELGSRGLTARKTGPLNIFYHRRGFVVFLSRLERHTLVCSQAASKSTDSGLSLFVTRGF